MCVCFCVPVCVCFPGSESKKSRGEGARRGKHQNDTRLQQRGWWTIQVISLHKQSIRVRRVIWGVHVFFFMLSCSIRRMYSTETTLNLNNGPCSLIFSPVSRHYFQLSKWHHLAFCLVAGNHTSTKKHTHHTHTHNTAHWRSTHFFFFFFFFLCRGRCGHWLWWLIQNAGFDTSRI